MLFNFIVLLHFYFLEYVNGSWFLFYCFFFVFLCRFLNKQMKLAMAFL